MDSLTGKHRFLRKTCDTEKQAEVELTKLLNQVDEPRQPRTKILVRQLIEKWFEVEDHEDSTPCGPRARVSSCVSSSSIRQIHFILRWGRRSRRAVGYLGVNPAALAEAPPPKKTTR